MDTSRRVRVALVMLAGAVLLLPSSSRAQARTIEVDFSKIVGTIKPLNGVNGGPIVTRGAWDLSSSFSELGIKHIRLHDVPWMYENAVDINYVFPRFEADVNNPESYDFFLTDYYLKSILSLGAEVTFRLGYSAEWPGHPPLHNVPPKDFGKWAAICAHIVQHYNGGWADGFHYNIRYWEIWNEPDGRDFWTGTPEEYYKLYDVTAKAIRRVDPNLKVGGPTLAGHLDFLEGFLKYCADHRDPLDFASWHIYSHQPYDVFSMAAKVQDLLNTYGYSKAESVLDEWNYYPAESHCEQEWRGERMTQDDARHCEDFFAKQQGGPAGAAFDASVLIYLQDSTVAIADFYQGTNLFWGALYDEYGVPLQPFFTFKAFRFLLDTPDRVSVAGSDHSGFAVIAGLSKDKSAATIIISNFGTLDHRYNLSFRGLPWNKAFVYEKSMIDSYHHLELTDSEHLSSKTGTLTTPEDVEAPSVCLVRLRVGP